MPRERLNRKVHLLMRRLGRDSRDDRGFTVMELMVVVLLMGIVLAIAGNGLVSLVTTTNRHGAMVDAEQAASTAVTQFARDVRSAHSIQFPNSSPNPLTGVILNINSPSGGAMTQTEWVYSSTANTFSRELLNSGTGAVISTRTLATNVVNGSATALRYYNYHGDEVTHSDPGTIANCTTRIQVQLVISPSTQGVASFTETADAALTDQLALLSLPGNGQC